jgi:tetratricopeptide (TPR) repeat protein
MRAELAAALAMAAFAQAASAQPAPAQLTVQQQFETASDALAAGRWQEAATRFEALEPRLAVNPRSLAIVRVRKGEALAALGREEESLAALKLGVPALPAGDAALTEDRYEGLVTLGELAERSLDYGEALKEYQAAEPLGNGILGKARAIRGLIQTGMFYDAPGALARADAAVAAAAALAPRDKHQEAIFRMLRGRVLLNMARPQEAQLELQRAVDLLGGLTERVDASDLASRSDLAIAALLSGDEEKARKYMAWTGAGQFNDRFPLGLGMQPPPCGADLAPGDVAVVEFSIRDDGTIGHATPIYSSRQGPNALAFAEAVSAWSWKPDELTHIGRLFRALTRVELRCSTRSQHPSVREILRGDLDRWLEAKGIAALDQAGRSDAARLKPLQAELARRETATGASSLSVLPVLADLATNPIVSWDDRRSYLGRGLAIARAGNAPPPVLVWFAIGVAESGRIRKKSERDRPFEAIRALLADAAIGGDPRATTAIRLTMAEWLYYSRDGAPEAAAILAQIPSTPGLDPHDSLRAAALARLASMQLVIGNPEAARATYAASGLSSNQCALLDASPRMKVSGAAKGGASFPKEALKWGFEGWVDVEYDVGATGTPANVRSVIAYPPFVFEKSANQVLGDTVFERTFRPDGGLGCGGMNTPVRFNLRR